MLLTQALLLLRKELVLAAEPDQPATYQWAYAESGIGGVSLSISTKPPSIKPTGVTSA